MKSFFIIVDENSGRYITARNGRVAITDNFDLALTFGTEREAVYFEDQYLGNDLLEVWNMPKEIYSLTF